MMRCNTQASTQFSTQFSTGNDPVSLALILEVGGDISDFRLLDCLARAVVVERRGQSRAERELVAEWCREQVAAWQMGSTPPDMAFLPRTMDVITALLWLSECLEDPELASRFEDALPPALKKKYGHGNRHGHRAAGDRSRS